MANQKWVHGGYFIVTHKMDASVFVKVLRTRPASALVARDLEELIVALPCSIQSKNWSALVLLKPGPSVVK